MIIHEDLKKEDVKKCHDLFTDLNNLLGKFTSEEKSLLELFAVNGILSFHQNLINQAIESSFRK